MYPWDERPVFSQKRNYRKNLWNGEREPRIQIYADVWQSADGNESGDYFCMYESEKALQETLYTEYYAACFENWKDRFAEIYNRYNKEMGPVKNSTIVDHEFIDDDVTVTTYDNNYQVYVNFGYVDYRDDSGLYIPAREYKVMKVED